MNVPMRKMRDGDGTWLTTMLVKKHDIALLIGLRGGD